MAADDIKAKIAEAERAAQANAGESEAKVRKIITYPVFAWGVLPGPEGARILVIEGTPDGVMHFPLGAESAAALGKQLSAPSIAVPGADRLPRAG